jgi:hypothetical protein
MQRKSLNKYMDKLTFFKMSMKLQEAGLGAQPPAGGLGAPPGGLGAPGGDALGGPMGGPPGMGGGLGGPMGGPPGMGGDPMGGGDPSMMGEPIPIKTIPAADVWGSLAKLVKDNKYDKFFDEINISRQKPTARPQPPERKTSLLK